ncbi:TIGR02680 family protein [Clostridium arbusti]|uniref:TIGR02680 family protein n=1 Tax=Clostridium arbusti TaxID=1137848 RepID=UPI000287D3F4|nr:TIGR02680 family protein [Clostridium arbusti]
MEQSRWIANKFGLLNFWYYDEEEFQLSDGKLLLRGTNGSGKSVTMQSFIPLLLDGNKSPERLDPFGTRSRKLENYLLDENTEEKTAYLYLEFKRSNSETYLTLGMGVKAQRGKSMDSWYFIINDGRRVNEDIFLYKKLESKVALTKKQLQNEMGASSFFTDSQQKYMAKVNEVLFGYEDVENYDELLTLLIQVRSPKLSKDFKPTRIYDILTDSLKLLSEDDLRPMSESMENMDQLQNSLEEKEKALKAVNSIKYYYDKYNRFCLYEKAKEYDSANREVKTKKREIKTLEEEHEKLIHEQKDTGSKLIRLSDELSYANEKYDSLRNNDAFRIKEKLNSINNIIQEFRKEVEIKENQLENKKKDEKSKGWKLKEVSDNRDLLLSRAKEKLRELKDLAQDFYFSEGEYIEKEVLDNVETYEFSFLESSLQKYISKIKEVKKLLRDYESEEENFNKYQQQCDLLINEKELKEEELEKSNMILTEVKEEIKEKYIKWEEKNETLKLSKENLNEVFKFINEIDGTAENKLITELDNSVTSSFNSINAKNKVELEFTNKNIEQKKEEIKVLENEIEELLMEKNIEPEREAGVEKNRERLSKQGISFIPLYKAIDFDKDIPDNLRKVIESALNDMGILDALIVNNENRQKALAFEENQWDKYIFLTGNMMRYNLSNYCKVNTEELKGVLPEEVYNILQGIYFDEDKLFSLDEKGNYVFGALRGKASQIYEPKYIGLSARKKHREKLIQDRQKQISENEKAVEELKKLVQRINNTIKILAEEYSSRPSFEDLQESVNIISAVIREIERLENETIKVKDKVFKLKSALNELKSKIYETSQGINIVKKYSYYEEAEELAMDFKSQLMEIKYTQVEIKNAAINIKNLEENIETLNEDIDNIYREISINKNKFKNSQTEEKALQDTLKTFDIGAIEKEIDHCLSIKNSNPMQIAALQKQSGKVETSLKNAEKDLNNYKEELIKKQGYLKVLENIFLEEVSLKYIFQTEEQGDIEMLKEVLQTIQMSEDKDRNYYSEQLIEAHHKNSGELREFNSKIVHIFEESSQDIDLDFINKRRRIDINCRVQGKKMAFNGLLETINRDIEELKLLISTEERRIFEEVLLNTISSKISAKIYLSRQWVDKINSLMEERDTSSGLTLSLKWIPQKAEREDQLDITELLDMMERGGRANDHDMKKLAVHFGDKVREAIRSHEETGEARNYQSIIKEVLDYRKWFEFKLFYTKKNERKRELTNNAFFQFSGGEKAMSMYIPLFSAVYARYENARKDCPRIIAMDEAFAGVDENNIRDMFKLLKDLKLDYVLNSQILWGDYDTVDNLSICELLREENDDIVSVIRYHWNGIEKKCLV